MGVCKGRNKVARSVIANDADGAFFRLRAESVCSRISPILEGKGAAGVSISYAGWNVPTGRL
jgi:hypothetical protein